MQYQEDQKIRDEIRLKAYTNKEGGIIFLPFSGERAFLFWIISKETVLIWIVGTYFDSMHLESPTAYNGLDHGFRNNLIVQSVSYDDDYREERK